MTPEQYTLASGLTDAREDHLEARQLRLCQGDTIDLLHAAMGCVTEAGELMDMLKKHVFYGKPIDTVNIQEECGDMLWYMAIICRTYGVSFEYLMQKNIEKLARRYPGLKFTEEKANNRNTANELEVYGPEVENSLKDAAAGKLNDLGSFAKYADEEVEGPQG